MSANDQEGKKPDPRENFLRPFEKQDRETLDRWGKAAKGLVDSEAETIAELTRDAKPKNPSDG